MERKLERGEAGLVSYHINEIEKHLDELDELSVTWRTEVEPYQKFGGVAHRFRIVFSNIWGRDIAKIEE